MVNIKKLPIPGYEKVIEGTCAKTGLHCLIAIHDTTLGPTLGGIRMYPYASKDEALVDVLRLAEGMTYKTAIAKGGTGGGKAVIIADPKKDKTDELLLAFAEVLNSLEGMYIAAEDVGTTTRDVEVIRQVSPYVVGLPLHAGSGDPSPFTAWGVYRGIQAVCHTLFGTTQVAGKKVAIQGLGKVGAKLAEFLFWHGAHLVLTDVDRQVASHLGKLYGADVVSPEEILEVECDILSPSAMGAIVNEQTIPHLRCKAIAGCANNQLKTKEDAVRLQERGILYAPDFVINAGGLINAVQEINKEGYEAKKALSLVNHIQDSLQAIFETAKREEKLTVDVAYEMARYNITHGIGKRKEPVIYSS